MAAPRVNTYHCLCTSLLLATTHTLSSLPRRASPALDHAIIVPLPPAPQPPPPPRAAAAAATSRPSSSSSSDSATGAETGAGASGPESRPAPASASAAAAATTTITTPRTADAEGSAHSSALGYTRLLSTTLDRRPTLIRRSDGFERRHLVRCGRCRLVVGYELAAEHYGAASGAGVAGSSAGAGAAMDVDGGGGVEEGEGRKEEEMKILYLLPGGIMSTEAMAGGKKIMEKEVVLGDGESAAVVAAWE